MFRAVFTAAALAAVGLCTGCASIVNGHNQSLSVKATSDGGDVSGAQCELKNDKGTWFTTTPGTVTVRRSYADLLVSCRMKDADPGTLSVKSSTKGMAFGNLIFGGVIGAGVDVASGAAYDYPSLISVPLPPGAAASAAPSSTPNAPVAAAATTQPPASFATLRAGSVLIVEEFEPISGVARSQTEFVVTEQTPSEWTFNQGRIVVRTDGTPVKGAMHDGLIYGAAPKELSRGNTWRPRSAAPPAAARCRSRSRRSAGRPRPFPVSASTPSTCASTAMRPPARTSAVPSSTATCGWT
jgi:hypothetical protein